MKIYILKSQSAQMGLFFYGSKAQMGLCFGFWQKIKIRDYYNNSFAIDAWCGPKQKVNPKELINLKTMQTRNLWWNWTLLPIKITHLKVLCPMELWIYGGLAHHYLLFSLSFCPKFFIFFFTLTWKQASFRCIYLKTSFCPLICLLFCCLYQGLVVVVLG